MDADFIEVSVHTIDIMSDNRNCSSDPVVVTPKTVDVYTQTEFSDDDMQTLIEAWEYSEAIRKFLCEMLQEGKSETKIPKFQILRLYQINGQEKKEAKKLEGAQLHNYLRSKLVESQDTVSMPDISSVEQNSTLDDILPELKTGLKCLKQHQMATLAISLAYGGWLNVAFDKFEKEKNIRVKPRKSGLHG
jgi:hypothetical protein